MNPRRHIAGSVGAVPRRRRRGRSLGGAALAVLGACATAWQPLVNGASGRDPAAYLRAFPPAPQSELQVWVTSWPEPVLLGAPQVVGDSLVGRRIAAPGATRGPRVAALLASVQRVEEYRTDVRGTTTLVVFGFFGVATLFYYFVTHGLS